MKRDDQDRFQQPYVRPLPEEEGLLEALALKLDGTRRLESEIRRDLDVERHGIGWWSSGLDTKRRILIGDHLLLCASSLTTNLVEAAVHLLEAQGAAENIERRLVGAVRVSADGRAVVDFPPSTCPEQDVQGVLVRMHVVGCVRALASALDCLAAVVVGVLAIPSRIFKTKYRDAIDDLERLSRSAGLVGSAASEVLNARRAAGPVEWDSWLLDYRNMLVHRGRHMWMTKLVHREVFLHAPGGELVVPHAMVPMLPRDPARSEVEVLRDASEQGFLLTESGWSTLQAARESTVYFCERTCRALLQAWSERRAEPTKLPQPAKQWPVVAPAVESRFRGYQPGSVPFDPSEFHAGSAFPQRLRAAFLAGDDRLKWDELDGDQLDN